MRARAVSSAAFVLTALASVASAADEPQFEVRQVADGVYAALARPRTPINCNGAFVVYDEGVLVVDTHSRPSSARALIAQIAAVTKKPVRYAVDTHFHWDHAQGAEAYLSAFPREVAIVSTEATRENLRTIGVERVKEERASAPGETTEIRKRLAEAKDPAERAKAQEDLRQQEGYVAELEKLSLVLPDLTFDKSMILHRKDRDIVLLYLGRGHTSGDVVAYFPQQKVVATGDLLHGWMPNLGDGYPPEWVATLDALAKLDFEWIIGGHGDVKPKAHVTEFRNYLADLIEETRKARGRGESLEQAKASVAASLRPRHAEAMGGEKMFDGAIGGNVEKVFRDMEARLY